MKFRQAAAIALVGWYLMVPLPHHPNAPLADWTHYDSYDSATECSEAQRALYTESKKVSSKAHVLENQIAVSECIASDDPRLKEK
jgi:hypothetical protein